MKFTRLIFTEARSAIRMQSSSALSERECASFLRRTRWPRGISCPHCAASAVVKTGRHLRVYRRYRCKSCMRIFNDKTGTIFQDSRMPLKVWFSVALLQRKMSILKVSQALGMYYYTTHRMVSKLRKSVYPDLVARHLTAARAVVERQGSRSVHALLLQVPRSRKTAAWG